mgnify:CR=1 FL=1
MKLGSFCYIVKGQSGVIATLCIRVKVKYLQK